MACSKGNEAETTNQTRACVRTFAWRHACQELTCVFVYSGFIYSLPTMCGEGDGRGGGGGQKEKEFQGCVCVAHSVAACVIFVFLTGEKKGKDTVRRRV